MICIDHLFLLLFVFIWLLMLPGGSDGKECACSAGDLGLVLGLGRSPGEGNGNPLQYSCLENSMDRGAWWGHKESDTTEQLTMLSNIFCFYWIFIFLFLYECPIFCSLPICFLLVLLFVRTLSHLPCLLSISLSHFFYVFNIIFLFLALKNIFIAEHKLCSPNAVVLILTGQL